MSTTAEERDGDRTTITLSAHGETIKVAPALGGRIVLSLDDGNRSFGVLVGVEEQDLLVAAVRRAQGRDDGPTVARVLAIHAQIAEESGEYRANLIELLLTELDKARAGLDATAQKDPAHADD